MTTTVVKQQLENYLPLLSVKQQSLLLDMAKQFLHITDEDKRISKKQYNKELNEAVSRIERGTSVSHEDALKRLDKW